MGIVIELLRPVAWVLCRLLFRIQFEGVENVPLKGACLITPNHVSYGDPIWLTIPLRRRVYYMAWDKPFEIPVLGPIMRAFGAFPVNVESVDASAQRAAKDVLSEGRALVIFPEGGRTRTGKLMPFKMGAFRFALTHGVPIVPVTIRGAEDIWPVGRIIPRPGKLMITYHPPIEMEAVEGINRLELKALARQLARRTRDVVASGLDAASLPEAEADDSLTAESNA
jgi:1-acyl-sn-glycerol-3-phosphate acyltransferase